MNKADIADCLAQKAGIPRVRAAEYLNIVIDAIQEELCRQPEGDEKIKVTISDFGTFGISTRAAFKGHNPKNGQEIDVPSRRIPVFRAGKGLKKSLNS